MRKLNSEFHTAFISEAGSELKNNDYFGFVELDRFACYVIADGIEDFPGAESAKLAIQSVILKFHEHPSMKKSAIRSYLYAANQALRQAHSKSRLKASITVVVTDYAKMRYGSAGNTRLRLYREGMLWQQSSDMSLSQDLVAADRLAQDLLARHDERNNLYSYLGQPREFRPFISKKFKLTDTDIIVLYTRGIWENLDSGELDDIFSEAQDDPQKTLDDAEDMLMSKQPRELENYTLAVVFVDKVFTDPNHRRRVKRWIITGVVVFLVLVIIILVVWLVMRSRAHKREDMNAYLESMSAYVKDQNFTKAQSEAEKAGELARKLRDKEKKADIDACQKLLDSIINADGLLAEGKYEDAQQAYLAALDRARSARQMGKEYIEKNLAQTKDYIEVYDLISDGDLLSDRENYQAAEQKYKEAKKLAADIYFTQGRKDASESLDKVYQALSDQADADKEAQQEAQEQAQKKAEASTSAAELIAQGDKAMQEGDAEGAAVAYTMAKQKLDEIEDGAGAANVDQKLNLANKQGQESEMLQDVADKYTKAGEQALASGDPQKAQEYYNKAKGIYAELGMEQMAGLMENKLEMDDPEAAQAVAEANGTANTSGKTTAGNVGGINRLTIGERQELLRTAKSAVKKGDEAYDGGEYMKARRYYRDARDCYEELGMDKLVDQMEDRISDCTNAYDQEVETDVSDLKERYAQAQQYEDQGDAALYAGEYDRAISLYYQARTIYSELELYQRVSDVQAKIDRVQQGMAQADKANAYAADGDNAMADGQYQDAIDAYRKARAIYMELGQQTLVSNMQERIETARKALEAGSPGKPPASGDGPDDGTPEGTPDGSLS